MPFLLNYENAGVSVPLLAGFIRNPNEHDLEPKILTNTYFIRQL